MLCVRWLLISLCSSRVMFLVLLICVRRFVRRRLISMVGVMCSLSVMIILLRVRVVGIFVLIILCLVCMVLFRFLLVVVRLVKVLIGALIWLCRLVGGRSMLRNVLGCCVWFGFLSVFMVGIDCLFWCLRALRCWRCVRMRF